MLPFPQIISLVQKFTHHVVDVHNVRSLQQFLSSYFIYFSLPLKVRGTPKGKFFPAAQVPTGKEERAAGAGEEKDLPPARGEDQRHRARQLQRSLADRPSGQQWPGLCVHRPVQQLQRDGPLPGLLGRRG